MKIDRSLKKKKSSGAWYPLCWRYEFCRGGEEQSSSTRMELKRSGAREGNLLKSPPTILTTFLRLSADLRCLRRIEARE